MKILFLGGGNMANALIGGMLKQGFAATDIHVIDPGAEARAKLSAAYAVNCHASADSAPAAPDLLLLAVKPQQMKEAVAPAGQQTGRCRRRQHCCRPRHGRPLALARRPPQDRPLHA
jgi:pyrroline-5-carboxylate reductase